MNLSHSSIIPSLYGTCYKFARQKFREFCHSVLILESFAGWHYIAFYLIANRQCLYAVLWNPWIVYVIYNSNCCNVPELTSYSNRKTLETLEISSKHYFKYPLLNINRIRSIGFTDYTLKVIHCHEKVVHLVYTYKLLYMGQSNSLIKTTTCRQDLSQKWSFRSCLYRLIYHNKSPSIINFVVTKYFESRSC